MPLKVEQLEGQLRSGLSPVYLLAGPEPLLLQECRDQVLQKAAAEGFSERQLIEASAKYDWDQLGEAGGTLSLFAQRRIIDLRLPSGKPGAVGAKALTAWVDKLDPDTLLVVSCEQWDGSSRKAKWAQALDRAGTRVDIWPLKPEELPGWIAARMQRRGLEPDQEAVMVLADRLQGNLLAAQQEIEKLALLKGSGPVSGADVLQAVADSSQFNGFLLSDRILEGNLQDSLRVAQGLRRTGVAIQLVAGALVSGLRTVETYRLAMAQGENEAGVFRRLNVWQSRQGALRQAARRIDGKRLADAWYRLAEMDRQSKGRAKGDPWHGLNRYIQALCA
jgi:DNA polymerase-3 subunit delta